MSVNKNALIRYKTIDACLQNRFRKWTLEDLIEKCADALDEYEGIKKGISKRTIRDDLQMMRSEKLGYNAPIIVVDKKYYTYEDKKYSITKIPMSTQELNLLLESVRIEATKKLKSVVLLLNGLPDLPHLEELKTVVLALEDQVSSQTADMVPTFFLEQRPAATGAKYLSDLDKHIQKKNVLNISYLPFKNPDGSPSDALIQLIIHPYFLKEYQRYWYLFGWSEDSQQVINYALGRIQKIEIARECSFIPISFNPKSYFDDIIGVTKRENKEVEVYKIRVNEQIAPYWCSRPLHHSQQVLNDHVFQFKLRWNYEWQNWILYYGKNVEVLEPKWFRDSIQQILSVAVKQYEN